MLFSCLFFFFLCFSLLNLSKSSNKLARNECFDLKKGYQISYYHDNICKNYSYCYILDLIYYSFQVLVFLFYLFYQTRKYRLILDTVFFAMSVCAFNSFCNGEYANLLIAAVFSNKSFSDKTFLLAKNSYLPIFPDDKAESA